MMMMMNCFCGMVDWRKAFSLISSRDHCQRSSPSRISDMPQAGFGPAQNLSSGLLEWSAKYYFVFPDNFFNNIPSTCEIIFIFQRLIFIVQFLGRVFNHFKEVFIILIHLIKILSPPSQEFFVQFLFLFLRFLNTLSYQWAERSFCFNFFLDF